MYLIHNYKEPDRINGFCRQNLGMFRGEKQAYYAYYTQYTHRIILQTEKPFSQKSVEKYAQNHDITRAKYLRKFAFDQMLALGIPESKADFIEGRVARKVGVRHYANLRRQSDLWYKKYSKYLHKLRNLEAK